MCSTYRQTLGAATAAGAATDTPPLNLFGTQPPLCQQTLHGLSASHQPQSLFHLLPPETLAVMGGAPQQHPSALHAPLETCVPELSDDSESDSDYETDSEYCSDSVIEPYTIRAPIRLEKRSHGIFDTRDILKEAQNLLGLNPLIRAGLIGRSPSHFEEHYTGAQDFCITKPFVMNERTYRPIYRLVERANELVQKLFHEKKCLDVAERTEFAEMAEVFCLYVNELPIHTWESFLMQVFDDAEHPISLNSVHAAGGHFDANVLLTETTALAVSLLRDFNCSITEIGYIEQCVENYIYNVRCLKNEMFINNINFHIGSEGEYVLTNLFLDVKDARGLCTATPPAAAAAASSPAPFIAAPIPSPLQHQAACIAHLHDDL